MALLPNGSLVTLAQLVGHDGSEITGIAFDPSYTRLLFASQRGAFGGGIGVSFLVEGPVLPVRLSTFACLALRAWA